MSARPRPRKKSTGKRSSPGPTAALAGPQRLQKVLAAAGAGSRRQCEELILAGRVEIDRQVVTELGTRVDLAEQEYETLKAHGKMPWAPVKRDTYLPRLLRRRYFKRMKALPEGPEKEAIREYFNTPGNSLDPFPVEDIGRLGRMLLDVEQRGDMDSVMGPPAPEAGPPAPEAGQPVSYHDHSEYYDYSINMNPVSGNREDRLMGARFDPYA